MAIYLITPLEGNSAGILAALTVLPAGTSYPLQMNSGFLVEFGGTTVELSQMLGITSVEGFPTSGIGSALITLVGSYYGFGSTVMWEWLKTRVEKKA